MTHNCKYVKYIMRNIENKKNKMMCLTACIIKKLELSKNIDKKKLLRK